MAREQNIKLGLGIAVVGILAFTVNYLMKQVRLLVNTEFEMSGTTINKLSLQEISITLWWRVVNKSDISINISEQVYDIYINGIFIKKVGNAIPVKIKARDETKIPTYVVFAPKDLMVLGFDNMGKFLTKDGRKDLELQVVGSMSVSTDVFEVKKFPIEFKDSIERIMNY